MQKPKLDYFSPLPPIRSGIADYSKELLTHLKKYFDITIFVDDNYNPPPLKGLSIKNYKEYKRGNPTIYNIGNNSQHNYIYHTLLKNPGIIILHDTVLHDLNFGMMQDRWSKAKFLVHVYNEEGIFAVINYLKFMLAKKTLKKNNSTKKEGLEFLQGVYPLEKDGENHFRWTAKKASFYIHEKNISEIAMQVYTQYPAKVILTIDGEKEKFILKVDKYQWITTKISPAKKTEIKIHVIKPLSFLSIIKDKHARNLGIKISKITYTKNDMVYDLPIANNDNITQVYRLTKKMEELKEKIRFSYPLHKKIIRCAKAIITHSKHAKKIVAKINQKIPLEVINMGVNNNQPKKTKENLKKDNALQNKQLVVCSFGLIQKHKRIAQALNAFAIFAKENKNSCYLLIGQIDESLNIQKLIKKYNLQEKVIRTGHLTNNKAMEYIAASDVCINLRGPSTGATSASLIKSLSVSTPCIISDLPENQEFPNSCVIKIKNDKNEIRTIAQKLNYLKEHSSILKEMSKSALEYTKENHQWDKNAKKIQEFIKKVYHENSNS